jgi:hypothetical protein
VVVAHNWYPSGWPVVLPHDALALHLLAATASVHDLPGSLDDLLEAVFGGRTPLLPDGLDGPVRWLAPEDIDDPDQTAAAAERRRQFETALRQADRPVPGTVRELAQLLVTIGVLEHAGHGARQRWRTPRTLPLPDEVLPLPADLAAALATRRWQHEMQPAVDALITHLLVELGAPNTVPTSMDELADAARLVPESVRQALVVLRDDGEVRLRTPDRADELNPETVDGTVRFELEIIWELFTAHHIHLRSDQ